MFGATAQWIAVAILLALGFVVLVLATDGGDFNPFSNSSGTHPGTVVGSGTASQPM